MTPDVILSTMITLKYTEASSLKKVGSSLFLVWHMAVPHRQFRTLPFALFCQI